MIKLIGGEWQIYFPLAEQDFQSPRIDKVHRIIEHIAIEVGVAARKANGIFGG